MSFVILGDYLIEDSNIQAFSVLVVVNRCRSCVGNIHNIRVLHSHPSRKHASEGTTENYHRTIAAVRLFEELDELNEVHKGLLGGQIN